MTGDDTGTGGVEHCPKCGTELKKLAPAPSDGVDGEPRYECGNCPRVYFEHELEADRDD